MRQLVECVPNFSEGRRSEIIDRIVAAMAAVPQVQVLGYESDADHNRSVVTLVGEPEAVLEAAFQGIKTAAELIDLDNHQGAHPRVGATDVVPFIPIEGLTMFDCVALAQRLGKRVGDELGIPVFLYEAAATRPENENLADVRKGEYEGLKEIISTDAARQPDFGPAKMGKAGATVIGARAPLIAYNVYLTTDNITIAQNIAKAIRHQTGGLRYVKALGLLVDGKAQVSMNLTNFTQTPVHRVVEMIRREAARYGVTIESSELVGLVPQQALFDAAQWYLQMDNFNPEQVLENKLTNIPVESSFLNALASADPAPGGGSAAAYAGAMAAGLVAMVGRVTLGKKKYADVEARMHDIIREVEGLRAELNEGVNRDTEAYGGVLSAMKLPKATPEQQEIRAETLEKATLNAAAVPLRAAETSLRVLKLAVEAAEKGNINAASDAGSAGGLANSSIFAAGLNVKINTNTLTNKESAKPLLDTLAAIQSEAAALMTQLTRVIHERAGLE